MFNFQSILNTSPQIKQYFSLYATNSEECLKLATQLLIESIQRRKPNTEKTQNKFLKSNQFVEEKQTMSKKTKENRYNVAYIKHNRFLSPSQKRQVTPKVTQVIPISPQKVFIYGKPKVKLDQFTGCPLHHSGCDKSDSERQSNHIKQTQIKERENIIQQKENIIESEKQQQYRSMIQQVPHQYEEYLQPKGKKNKRKSGNDSSYNNNKTSKRNQTINFIQSPKNMTNKASRMTSPKSFISQTNQSHCQNYSNVESKIKQLIQRDKRNRQIEKQVEKQKQQIEEIQERQNRLFLRQKQQQQEEEMIQNQIERSYQSQLSNQNYPIKYPYTTEERNLDLQSSITSSSEQSIVNLHGHLQEESRIECYECQIERLRKRKQKAKKAIKEIERQQAKRSQLLIQIAQNSHLMREINPNHSFDQSYNDSINIY